LSCAGWIVLASCVVPALRADVPPTNAPATDTPSAFAVTNTSAESSPATNAPAVVHITDEEDKLLDGHLASSAEKRARANALYAQAMLMTDAGAGDEESALGLFRQIVALDPGFIDAQVKLANLLLQSGKTDAALAQLHSAARIHPDSVPVEVELGYAEKLRGHTEEALHLCTRALVSDPEQAVAMRVMLEIAGDQDDIAGGVVHIEDILRAGGASVSATAWTTLAQLYLEIARGTLHPPMAETLLRTRLPMLQEAAIKPPPDVTTLTLLADTYRTLGRRAEALKALRNAAEIEPDNVDVLIHCADLEMELEQKAAALADYEKAYALNPGLPGLRELLGGLYLDAKRFEEAARLFQSALADSPDNAALRIDLGIAYEQAHQPEQAQACFQQVFSSTTCPPEAYLKLAFYQLEHSQIDHAGQTLSAATTRFPQSARIRFYQAVQQRYAKNYVAAIESLSQVRKLAVGAESAVLDPNYYLEAALTLNLAGKTDELETVLREAIKRFPDDPDLMNELAYFWAEGGRNLDEALALGKRAAVLDPDNGPVLDTCGWAYFKKGDAKAALPYLQRAAVLTNNDPVVLQHVGDALNQLGQKREALAAWQRALQQDPGNGDLTSRINAVEAQAKNVHLRSAPSR
jgi:tetratricopeptide (TPR) repeat protein